MTLAKYLRAYNITSHAFARKINHSVGAVDKWRQGARVPRRAALEKITKATGGKVTYRDWYAQ